MKEKVIFLNIGSGSSIMQVPIADEECAFRERAERIWRYIGEWNKKEW